MTAGRGVKESRRPTLYGRRQAISSGHYLASAAGFAILEAGGNAIDAGCAAGIALAVLHADEVNVAGVAPIMIRTGRGEVVTIAGLGHWPAGIPADLFMREHSAMIPVGILQTVVPAAPDAWITALRDYGTMTFADVAAAATRYARDGFAAHEHLCDEIAANVEHYRRWPSNAAIFLPDGRPPAVGDRFVQSDLAGTLQYMADEERAGARRGRVPGLEAARAAFYCGDIARAIVAYHQEHGGYLTRADLASFRSRHEPPVRVRWRDMEVITCGPWCQGPVVAQTLTMAERAGLAGMAYDSPEYAHLMIELLKGAFADREYHYGDPRFVDVGLERLLSDAHVAARVGRVDRDRATPGLPGPIGEDPAAVLVAESSTAAPTRPTVDTSYVCVIDRWGNAFSATPSDGSWGAPVIPGLGIVPSERGMQSRPDPRHPSGVAPGKRPRLTPNPALAVRDDGSVFAFGCPGGDMQPQAMVQVFLNVFHFGMDIQEAINAPRFSTWSFPNSFAPFEYLPGRVALEDRFPAEVAEQLSGRGHDVVTWPEFTRAAAAVEAIYCDARTGFLRAGADPRQPAYAIVD
ncbi:MAG TPA: gamma-glutamyltransferase [Solirubrobacteraceae bacterium]|jgi:gamma-glutamyltranspeptidase/glutathione hydrolase|nr:gamma-glutamyltransferase [Solirubrobacteraceae bacterium]